ncbi:hypothetical protein IMZ48_33260 [Candidatus Bathyarchaeota archaeon]|nr:hypothetical protein [Candidatus Bathyarchaeota archaeon]
MPPATGENAAMSMSHDRAQQNHDSPVSMTMKKGASAAAPSPDDETVQLRKQTRTWDYIWRSGVAGGLAGCAVCRAPFQGPVLWLLQSSKC